MSGPIRAEGELGGLRLAVRQTGGGRAGQTRAACQDLAGVIYTSQWSNDGHCRKRSSIRLAVMHATRA